MSEKTTAPALAKNSPLAGAYPKGCIPAATAAWNRTTGAPPTLIPFSIDGTTVKALVPLELLGNPLSFGWNAATRPLPPAAYLDIAPNGCDPSPVPCGLATWTQ
jgi:hypothetical protein